MSAVDEHAEAHRLKAERGWGARRIGAELGITRYAAEQLLARPIAEGREGCDPRLEAIVTAIVGSVPRAVEARTVVRVEYTYTQLGLPSTDSWTGPVLSLAERIFEALFGQGGPLGGADGVPSHLVLEFRGRLAETLGIDVADAVAETLPDGDV